MYKRHAAALLLLALLTLLPLAACRAAPVPGDAVSGGETSVSLPEEQTPPVQKEEPVQTDVSQDPSAPPEQKPAGEPAEEPAEHPAEEPAENPAPPQEESPAQPPQEETPQPPPQEEAPQPPEETPAEEPAPVKPSNNRTLYILMYHHVIEGDKSKCNDWTTTTQCLREDLQWLKDHGYTSLLPSELAAGTALPEKAVLITFDDGYASNYKLAYPLLQEFNAKAVISMIVRRTVDGKSDFLTWDMCREMAASGLVEIGSHTYDSHKDEPRGIQRIKGESREAYEARIFPELEESIRLIEENVGQPVQFFAYPHGQTEPWADGFLREHFAVTVTTDHGAANTSRGLYDLPRFNINPRQPASKYLPD